MKLLGEGGTPKPFVMYGELKSSISSFKSIPVDPDMTLEPKLRENNKFWEDVKAAIRRDWCGVPIQVVDGAGGGYGAAVLCYHGDVRGPVVLRQVKLRLVVVHRVRGVVRDLLTQLISVGSRSHFLDHLEENPGYMKFIQWRNKSSLVDDLHPWCSETLDLRARSSLHKQNGKPPRCDGRSKLAPADSTCCWNWSCTL